MKKTNKYSEKELAEAFIFPRNASAKEKALADKDIAMVRMNLIRNMSDEQKLYGDILQLKYKLDEYVSSSAYSHKYTFGFFLAEYLRLLNKKRKDFAKEINLHETRLSRILNGVEEPNRQLIYRLEYHSSRLIPAISWWKLIEKGMEYILLNDVKTQNKEHSKVKNRLVFGF